MTQFMTFYEVVNFGNIDTLLSLGHEMDYIAKHYNMDLPLVWALRLEGKTDQEKLKLPATSCGESPTSK